MLLGPTLYVRLASIPDARIFIFLKRVAFNLGFKPFKSFPGHVSIEINGYCNRRCPYCPNSKFDERSDTHSMISEDLFRKIIDELSELKYHRTIYYNLYNEPLTDTRLPYFVEYTRAKLPHATIDIYTNGDYLDYDLYSLLVQKGVDRFCISIHDKNVPSRLSETLSRVSAKEKTSRMIIKYVYKDYKEGKDIFFNRGGSLDIDRKTGHRFCPYILALNITYKGDAILCCNDYFSKHLFGNVREQRLRDIWFAKEYSDLRNRVALGYRDLAICKKCDI